MDYEPLLPIYLDSDLTESAKLCKLSYSNEKLKSQGYIKHKIDSTDTEVFLNIDNTNLSIDIIFRGTDSKEDWTYSLNILSTPLIYDNNLPQSSCCARDINVHKGFYYKYLSVSTFIYSTVSNIIKNLGTSSQLNLRITGHSLGGALAQICAVSLKLDFREKVHIMCHTFGNPRAGNSKFASALDTIVDQNIMVVNDNDSVCDIPSAIFYRHPSNIKNISRRSSDVQDDDYPSAFILNCNFFSKVINNLCCQGPKVFKNHDIDEYINNL